MFKYGWARLWVVVTGVLFAGVAVQSAYSVWGTDPCYRFVSVSVADNIQEEDRQLADAVKREAITKSFCGKSYYSALLTLETLAERGVVTQVAFQWLEPDGWSFAERGTLIVLDKSEIKMSKIIDNASVYVYRARFFNILWLMIFAISASVLLLVLGIGIAWIRRGFSK